MLTPLGSVHDSLVVDMDVYDADCVEDEVKAACVKAQSSWIGRLFEQAPLLEQPADVPKLPSECNMNIASVDDVMPLSDCKDLTINLSENVNVVPKSDSRSSDLPDSVILDLQAYDLCTPCV